MPTEPSTPDTALASDVSAEVAYLGAYALADRLAAMTLAYIEMASYAECCPRCGEDTSDERSHATSRVTNLDICARCGIEEGLEARDGQPSPITAWPILESPYRTQAANREFAERLKEAKH